MLKPTGKVDGYVKPKFGKEITHFDHLESMNRNLISYSKPNSASSVLVICLVFLFVHGLLLGFGWSDDASLLSGDRATSRNAAIAYVFDVEKLGNSTATTQTPASMPKIGDRILNSGHAGDYLIQGVIIKLSNSHVLVIFQMLLALASTLCLFSLLRIFNFSEKYATGATLFYLLLPGSLLPAHQLCSEALFIPCAIIGCYLLIVASNKKGIDLALVAGLLLLSVTIFVRPQLILFPFVLAAIYLFFSEKKLSTIMKTVMPLSLLFSMVWVGFVISDNGRVTFGGEDRSIGMTFHNTAEQMAMSGDFEFDANAYQTKSMLLSDFARIVIENPYSYLRQRAISMVNFVVNPGAYSLVVRHLKYINKNDDRYYWQHLRARAGIYESFIEILKRGPLFTLLIFSTMLIWCMVLVAAVVGLLPFIKDKTVGWFAKSLLLSLAVYQIGTVMLLSVGARWQQRSLLDFIVIVLALYGLKMLQQRFSRKKQVEVARIEPVSLESQKPKPDIVDCVEKAS